MRTFRWFLFSFLLGAMPASADVYTIWVGDDCALPCFSPNPLRIQQGDTVEFRIYCSIMCVPPLNIVGDDGSFRCARGCDGEGGDGTPTQYLAFSRTFDEPGLVGYHDEVSAARGLIIVDEAFVVEYFNGDLGHYFLTASRFEQAYLQTGMQGNWKPTGFTFKFGGSAAVCRFAGNPMHNALTGRAYGPNSHFYTADEHECGALRAAYKPSEPSWYFERIDFKTTPVGSDGQCAPGLQSVHRAYNDGFARGEAPNHRIVADTAAYQAMLSSGWIGEGVVMCAPP